MPDGHVTGRQVRTCLPAHHAVWTCPSVFSLRSSRPGGGPQGRPQLPWTSGVLSRKFAGGGEVGCPVRSRCRLRGAGGPSGEGRGPDGSLPGGGERRRPGSSAVEAERACAGVGGESPCQQLDVSALRRSPRSARRLSPPPPSVPDPARLRRGRGPLVLLWAMRHRSAHPAGEFASKLPIVFWHGFGGEVCASGVEVTELRGGDRVAVTPWPYRRDCR
jgi:hypothetical protein